MTVNLHKAVEQPIVKHLVRQLLKEGFYLSVYDGEETTLEDSQNAKEVEKALFTTDEDVIKVAGPDKEWIGDVFLVYGNEADVISDYHVSLEPWLEPIMKWVDETYN